MRIRSYLLWALVAVIGGGAVAPPRAAASGSFEAPAPTVSIDPNSLGPRGPDGGSSHGDWGRAPKEGQGSRAGPIVGDLRGVVPALPAIDAFIARQPGSVVVAVSRHGFLSTVQRLKAAIRAQDLVLVASFDIQATLARSGAVVGGNQILDVYPPAVVERLMAAELAAGGELPVRVYIYEDGSGQTWVKYHSLQQRLSLYADPRLIALGQEVDAQMAEILARALE